MCYNILEKGKEHAVERRIYAAIDLKSFYASVECVERGLDPLDTNLVVADGERTEKTICLAVTPTMKRWGIPGRPRLFEVIAEVKRINSERQRACRCRLTPGCYADSEIRQNPALSLDYIVAPPRMALYMEYSAKIYEIYTRHVSPEDIHVYSVDEVFMDITSYVRMQRISPEVFIRRIIQDVLDFTGITATAGIGTNLYLAKVAMDILAKRAKPDRFGVRIAKLDEMSYRRELWLHKPLTDFWRVGRGYAERLAEYGLYTMGDVAKCSLNKGMYGEELLYKLFGVNAELLIDHAWGYESCTMADIKAYRPTASSLGAGQVLHCAYDYLGARLIVREMADTLALDLFEKGLRAEKITLNIGYDIENLTDPKRNKSYAGAIVSDHYGRKVPKGARGTVSLGGYTSSARIIAEGAVELFDRIADEGLLVRRINITAHPTVPVSECIAAPKPRQLSIFEDAEAQDRCELERQRAMTREEGVQGALVKIKRRFGKNAIIKGMNLVEGATARDRNAQIGGHRA